EALRSQVLTVRAWKEALFVRGRPHRYRNRKITADGLEQLICQIFGFVQRFLGKTPQTLSELLIEDYVSRYAEFRLTKRGVQPLTVADDLRMIPPLGRHPLLRRQDFTWIRDLISDLPPHSEAKARERKERNWKPHHDLARVPD